MRYSAPAVAFVFVFVCLSNLCFAQASVDETLETAHIYVDAVNGSDSNPGTSSKPFKTIGAAANVAVSNNQANIGTKVTINPGTYRESITLNYSNNDTSKPITFEAATAGTAIVSGAEKYKTWTQYSGNASIYTHNWTKDYSLCAQVNGCPTAGDIVQHQEMAVVNGAVLTQVLSMTQMQAGTFFADNSGNTMYIWPASGTDMSTATVEVATTPQLFTIWKKSNIVVRGLVFQYANSCRGNPAVNVTGDATNILFDNDTFQWNNGQGLAIVTPVTDFTVMNSESNHNGDAGWQANQLLNGLWQNDVANYNNWRGAQGAYYACNTGGAHFWESHAQTLTTFTTAYNQGYGVHWDTDNKNVTGTGMIAANNLLTGLYSEKNQGPITVSSSYSCNQNSVLAGGGFSLRNSENITLSNDVFLNNSPAQVMIIGVVGGTDITDWETGNTIHLVTQDLTFKSNTVQSNDSTQKVFKDSYLDGSDWTSFENTLVASNNTWWNAYDSTTPFQIASPKDGTKVDFSGWKSTTGQDSSSSFKAPSGTPGASCTITPDKDFWVTLDNASLTTDSKGKATFNVYLTALSFTGTVNFTLDGITAVKGLTGTLGSSSIKNSGTTTLTITKGSTTPKGTYPITLIANNAGTTHTVTVQVTTN